MLSSRILVRRSTPWARRFVADSASDHNALAKIMHEEAEKAEAKEAADTSISWQQQQGTRRTFAPGLFIRPHYWSHEHRFEKRKQRTAPPSVGPGKRQARERDALHHFNIDPVYETSNTTLLASFVSEMGKIKSRIETGLTAKTQRRLGRAVRRAKMMGILPQLSNPRLGPRPS